MSDPAGRASCDGICPYGRRPESADHAIPMSSSPRFLTALPVYNEFSHVNPVLDEVVRSAQDVLVVDDGSVDGTSELLAGRNDIRVIRHQTNRGYGAALITAFAYAIEHKYDVLVT